MAAIVKTVTFSIFTGPSNPNGITTPDQAGDIYIQMGTTGILGAPGVFQATTAINTGWTRFSWPDLTNGSLGVQYRLRIEHPGGNVDATAQLPPRPNGWRVVDATLRSRGGTAGNMTLRTAAGGGGTAVTNAMVPGNANLLTKATTIVQAVETFAGGSVLYANGASNPPATDVDIEIVGL